MFKKLQEIKAWLKGRLLSRKQLHDSTDPANAAVTAVEDALAANAESAVIKAVTPNTLPPTLAEIVAKEVSGGMQ